MAAVVTAASAVSFKVIVISLMSGNENDRGSRAGFVTAKSASSIQSMSQH